MWAQNMELPLFCPMLPDLSFFNSYLATVISMSPELLSLGYNNIARNKTLTFGKNAR